MSKDIFLIDVWSDVVCPFCYLGSRQLTVALESFEHRDIVQIRHHAFELDRNAKTHHGSRLSELVAKKYSMPVERADALHAQLAEQGRELGITFHFDVAIPTNTFDAHRLLALASSQNKGHEMSERLFRAYFTDGELVSDHAQLTSYAEELGVTSAQEMLASNAFEKEVRDDELAAEELGISGVPSLVVDEKFMIVGAQGAAQILDVLRRAWARRSA
jgi:predicted DsbA family dithiol-disulfide isomerase